MDLLKNKSVSFNLFVRQIPSQVTLTMVPSYSGSPEGYWSARPPRSAMPYRTDADYIGGSSDKYFWRGPDNTDRTAASTEESMPDYLQYKDCTDNQ